MRRHDQPGGPMRWSLQSREGAVLITTRPPCEREAMQPGTVLADRFEIEALAGSGAMGTVYRGRDRRSGDAVAVKLLRATDHAARFEREARILANLSHPAIVSYVAHGV